MKDFEKFEASRVTFVASVFQLDGAKDLMCNNNEPAYDEKGLKREFIAPDPFEKRIISEFLCVSPFEENKLSRKQ